MRVAVALATMALVVACNVETGRESGADLVAHSALTADHGGTASLRVVFLPTPERCSPQDLIATRTLARLEQERDDVAVLTIIPGGLPRELGMNGLPFPGHIIHLPLNVVEQSRRKVARPRLEVYSSEGQLLLLRPVSPHEEQRLLYEEILGLLRYTAEKPS